MAAVVSHGAKKIGAKLGTIGEKFAGVATGVEKAQTDLRFLFF